MVVGDRQLQKVAELLRDRVPSVRQAATVSSLMDEPGSGAARVDPGAIGLIQYTSGSTGRPKGVTLTQQNLLANMRCIGKGLGLGPEDVAVSWVPLYHDMGFDRLLDDGDALRHAGGDDVASALPHPTRALAVGDPPPPDHGRAVAQLRLRAVLSEGARRGDRRSRPVALAAGPQRSRGGAARDHRAVQHRERLRSERRAVPAADGEPTVIFPSVGVPLDTQELRIVAADAEGLEPEEVPERTEGRILMRGPSVMEGYFHQPEATAAVRVGSWTETGDLGYLADGELFITGRIKDVLIKAGRNYHPQDLEGGGRGRRHPQRVRDCLRRPGAGGGGRGRCR